MHCFVIRVEPTAAAASAQDIAGAIAHVWVNDTDRSSAETAARGYIMNYGWMVNSIELTLTPTPAQIAQLDAIESESHARACRDGIYATFTSWLKEPRREDSPVELRPLSKPPASEADN